MHHPVTDTQTHTREDHEYIVRHTHTPLMNEFRVSALTRDMHPPPPEDTSAGQAQCEREVVLFSVQAVAVTPDPV